MRRTAWMVAAVLSLAACGDMTAPDKGGGSGSGGPVGQVMVGNTFFRSARNGSENPAVDTIAAGGTITWSWIAEGSHSIQSTGLAPAIFKNSVVLVGTSYTYTVAFRNPGTYTYDCGVDGSAMTGRIVVQ